ncbi:uncharacterized protein FOMMEDRAFT_142433 [Fomitiporia mediterranea MF3/22]|uniref:uncharacterized protein n=1 Tax=Fomitiporia mediterranea (strain MF3/22) TaxID=694068 RepID=UPI0004408A40|nr:uncharacterized protein FOMMEDRAFT_142433 [Fomitiporia mediterranea MF3/22]EJD00629.1 hypothetical protein FOMMEDRAFT_142433 [Fomitiporia mediterranea MF3/22]
MLNTVASEDSHAVIPSYLLSNENDAAPYTRWHPEIFHYIRAIYWTNCCRGSLGLSPIGGRDVFTEEHARLIVLGNFKEYWVTQFDNARGTFGKQFPFFLIVDEVNGHNIVGQYKYRPKPNVALFKDDFPRFLAEFDSLTNQDNKHRLLVQMACALCLALAFRRADGCHDENFFLMGAFFTKEWHIYRYFFYSNEGKVCYLERDFNMAHADDLMTFLHEFYNYVFYINVADTLGDKDETEQKAKGARYGSRRYKREYRSRLQQAQKHCNDCRTPEFRIRSAGCRIF